MAALFTILFLVAMVGVFRPFQGLKRKHFGIAAGVFFVLVGLTAPPSPTPRSGAAPKQILTPAQQKATAEQNREEIARLRREARALAEGDLRGGSRIYTRLAQLDPGNAEFVRQRDRYAQRLTAAARFDDHPEEALEITHSSWRREGFGAVMVLDVTVSNAAPFPIKDFEVRCIHQGPSGTDIDSNTQTVYEIVPPNGHKRVREVNMGFIHSQVATSSCEITDAVRA
jgi:hypothetical protein